MKKFKASVTKEYEYEIEIDENVWTDEAINEWQNVFYSVYDLKQVVECLACLKTDYEDGEYIEGFGIPYINGKAPYVLKEEESSLSKDINIKVITDGDTEADVEEIIN